MKNTETLLRWLSKITGATFLILVGNMLAHEARQPSRSATDTVVFLAIAVAIGLGLIGWGFNKRQS